MSCLPSHSTPRRVPQPRASTKEWIAVLAGMIGAFMAILNIQITNASLLDIEGGIGTGVDNGAWISTSYLIGEIVVIPAHRLFQQRLLVSPLHPGEHDPVPAVLHSLCLRPRPWFDDCHARPAGLCRRRADPDGLHHGVDQAAEIATAGRPRPLRPLGHLRSGDRPDDRRLSDRELRMADHLLYQCRTKRRHGRCAGRNAGQDADATPSAERRRLGRHLHHGSRTLGASDRARRGQ